MEIWLFSLFLITKDIINWIFRNMIQCFPESLHIEATPNEKIIIFHRKLKRQTTLNLRLLSRAGLIACRVVTSFIQILSEILATSQLNYLIPHINSYFAIITYVFYKNYQLFYKWVCFSSGMMPLEVSKASTFVIEEDDMCKMQMKCSLKINLIGWLFLICVANGS